jgi:tetratricopeptide (TPR) repeat protein
LKIFLSYASQDQATAEAVAFSLRSRQYQVFLDRDDLPPGESYDQRIERAVNDSEMFIFLVSPDSIAEGRYTLTELSFARRKWPDANGRVLPVMARKTPLEQAPSYLKAVTVLEPAGNIAAETSAAVDEMRRKAKWSVGQFIARYTNVLVASVVILALGLYFVFEEFQKGAEEKRYALLRDQIQALSKSSDPLAAPIQREAIAQVRAKSYDRAAALVTAEQAQVRGLQLIQSGDSKQALDLFLKVGQDLDNFPATDDSTNLHLIRGYLYKDIAQASESLNDSTRAERYYNMALKEFAPIKEDPDLRREHPDEFASAVNGMGNILDARGHYREAIKNYQLATSIIPDYASLGTICSSPTSNWPRRETSISRRCVTLWTRPKKRQGAPRC